MDFEPTAEQQAVADVVTSVLARDLTWTALVDGGVTALAVPERLGGDGVGLLEVSTVLAEVGRHGAVTPALATLGLGVVPLLALASEAQQDRILAGVAKGAVLSAALNEPGVALPDRPATRFANGRLSGTKLGVAYAGQADWLIVTADGAVVVVSSKADGVQLVQTLHRTDPSNTRCRFMTWWYPNPTSWPALPRPGSISWRWRCWAPTPTGWWRERCA